MPLWIDSHNHLHDARLGDPKPVIAAMRETGIEHCVVNATHEVDWADVEKLANDYPGFITPVFGIHPWRADTATTGWEKRLLDLLEKYPKSSVGECGLDGWISSPSIEVQQPVFQAQLRIARELDRPITIHALKAWEPLFEAFENEPPPNRFLMHSFGGSWEIAQRLIPLGAYFSFSGYFLQGRKSAVLETFRKIPRDRILLETDSPDMLPPEEFITHPLAENRHHPANLASIATALAKSLNITPEVLADITRENHARWITDVSPNSSASD